MNLLSFAFLADENIHPEVVAQLRARSVDVRTVAELGLSGAPDLAILGRASADGCLVLTHDPDFGRLAVHTGAVSQGVVLVTPGHMTPAPSWLP